MMSHVDNPSMISDERILIEFYENFKHVKKKLHLSVVRFNVLQCIVYNLRQPTHDILQHVCKKHTDLCPMIHKPGEQSLSVIDISANLYLPDQFPDI